MDYRGSLNKASSFASSSIEECQEKIRRLKEANAQLENEQRLGRNEINKIQQPVLQSEWEGPRSVEFEQSRHAAFLDMQKVFKEDFEDYQDTINEKISSLQQEIDFLTSVLNTANFLHSSLNAIDHTAEGIQKSLDSIGAEINKLSRGLFS